MAVDHQMQQDLRRGSRQLMRYLRFCAWQWAGAAGALTLGVLTYVQTRWHERWPS